jgi:DNA-binding protein HU-beta
MKERKKEMSDKKPMTKTQIVDYLAERFAITKATSKAIIDELGSLAAKKTKALGEFTIPGIGKLVKQKRKARKGRNPATGEEIKIPAKTVVKMRLAKIFKDAVVPSKK